MKMHAQIFAGLLSALLPLSAANAQSVLPISCMIVPWREAGLGLDHAGIVAARHGTRNQQVREGEVLLELEAGLLRADLARAELTHDELSARLERSEALTRNNVIARDEIEKLRMEARLAQVELSAARERLAKTALLAPFDGVITGTAVERGELTGAEPLMTLAEVSRLKALIILPIEAWGQYQPGQEIEIGVELAGLSRKGQVISVDSFIDASANSFRLEVALENAALDLPPGAACQPK